MSRPGEIAGLVITADDFGLAPEVNAAVARAHREGILTAASLMIAGTAAEDAVATARRLPSLRVGLHLVLADGTPRLAPDAIPDLVDGNGRLLSDLPAMGRRIFRRRSAREQLAAEMDAQFAAFRETGLALDHVNAHHHFHVHPSLAPLLLAVGARYGMRAVRVPRERASVLDRIDRTGPRRVDRAVAPCARWLGLRLRRHGITVPRQVFGLAWSGAMTERRLAGLVADLPAGLSEIYLHPATTNAFAGAVPGYLHREELAALTSPAVIERLRASGVRTGGYADFIAR